jgi:hypothetical protein
MLRVASNYAIASNYGALGSSYLNQISIPLYPDAISPNGPWLGLYPDNLERSIPQHLILTKTHCSGYCNGKFCDKVTTIQNVQSFGLGCCKGRGVIDTPAGIKTVITWYSRHLVKKAIHLFRHPLDNIVSRFYFEYNKYTQQLNDTQFGISFPRNATGFQLWCAHVNEEVRRIIKPIHLADPAVYEVMREMPCGDDFYRYIQWHNLAFDAVRDMNIPTMILQYHEYEHNFTAVQNRLLDWMNMSLVDTAGHFIPGKSYIHYYTPNQRKAVYNFMTRMASNETWEVIKNYDYLLDSTDASQI